MDIVGILSIDFNVACAGHPSVHGALLCPSFQKRAMFKGGELIASKIGKNLPVPKEKQKTNKETIPSPSNLAPSLLITPWP